MREEKLVFVVTTYGDSDGETLLAICATQEIAEARVRSYGAGYYAEISTWTLLEKWDEEDECANSLK